MNPKKSQTAPLRLGEDRASRQHAHLRPTGVPTVRTGLTGGIPRRASSIVGKKARRILPRSPNSRRCAAGGALAALRTDVTSRAPRRPRERIAGQLRLQPTHETRAQVAPRLSPAMARLVRPIRFHFRFNALIEMLSLRESAASTNTFKALLATT